ncbi:hypothetical protein [Enorma burkinafasonensis]|uniref:hypothetical protein n=1 Tax=Enorma burkinafasonensis TaxID=2590867 RepID=UPI0011A58B06|nr:hypothetical protein [Enorma burkinafasonensis]
MEYTILAMAGATFAMVVYIMASMPTKKDLRKLADDARPREAELERMLRERIGSVCELVLAEAGVTAGGMRLAGTVLDVDDEWVLMECPDKKGGAQLKALRIALVEGVESA